MAETRFRAGDSVRVRPDVKCPDDERVSIGGWQGRVKVAQPQEGTLIVIQWDSPTLRQIPLDYIVASEKEGLDWSEMMLGAEQIEPATPRDTSEDATALREEMQGKYWWLAEGKQGERIFNVIAKAEMYEEIEAWETYLRKRLTFPFDARIAEHPEIGPLEAGDRVRVTGFEETDDLHDYGVLVRAEHEGEDSVLALCDLKPLDRKSPNFQPVADYSMWYANQ